ncbi:MAG: type II secretion system protein [Methylotenera sp.]|nr:type II secretion system protein [Methylotenera sp.]
MITTIYKAKGFTLVEMAIVLTIIGIMLGGFLVSLTAQLELRSVAEARQLLGNAQEALMGYSLGNRHLPCPDKVAGADNGDNDRPNDGREDFDAATGTCITQEGNLPWATLGLLENDPWEQRLIYRVVAGFSQRPTPPLNSFGLATPSNIRVCNEAACNVPRLTDVAVAVVVSRGRNRGVCNTLPSLPACEDERQNDNGDNDFVSHEPRVATLLTPNAEYDDIVVWLSGSILINRMVAAGQLP